MPEKFRHVDLFSGIGGFSLAAQWVWGEAHEIACFVEIDKFCHKILRKHWPSVPIVEDVNDLERIVVYATSNGRDGYPKRQCGESQEEGRMQKFGTNIDLVTGGVPCQPSSCAGKRKGTEDDRWLWPQALAVVDRLQPRWVIFENPTGFLSLNKGVEYESVLAHLEAQGYWTESFVIPASAVGAPHRRDRVWIVGHSKGNRSDTLRGVSEGPNSITRRSDSHAPHPHRGMCNRGADQQEREAQGGVAAGGTDCDAADTARELPHWRRNARPTGWDESTDGVRFCGGQRVDGSGGPWDEHWYEAATRLCGISHGLPRRVDRVNRLKALGNSVVPQVVAEILRAIKAVEWPDVPVEKAGPGA